jgi:hypothetical protein
MKKELEKISKFWKIYVTFIAVFCLLFSSILSISINSGDLGTGGNALGESEPLSGGPSNSSADIVTGISSSRIVLDWDDVASATGYNVYYAPEPRYLDDDNNRKMDATGITDSTHTISNLSPWTNVFIKVEVLGRLGDEDQGQNWRLL